MGLTLLRLVNSFTAGKFDTQSYIPFLTLYISPLHFHLGFLTPSKLTPRPIYVKQTP